MTQLKEEEVLCGPIEHASVSQSNSLKGRLVIVPTYMLCMCVCVGGGRGGGTTVKCCA